MDIEVVHDASRPVCCPQCRREYARYNHAPERTWRHLDVMQFTTQIRARLPRCACPEHGVVTLVPMKAEPGLCFTLLFEALAVQVLKAVGGGENSTCFWQFKITLGKKHCADSWAGVGAMGFDRRVGGNVGGEEFAVRLSRTPKWNRVWS